MATHSMIQDLPQTQLKENSSDIYNISQPDITTNSLHLSTVPNAVSSQFESKIQNSQMSSSEDLNSQITYDSSIWDLDKTLEWLQENDLTDFTKLFKINNIHGEKLFTLNHKVLRSLGVNSYKDRSRAIKAVKKCFPLNDSLTIQTDVRNTKDPYYFSSIRSPIHSNKNNLTAPEIFSPENIPFDSITLIPESDCFQDDLSIEPTNVAANVFQFEGLDDEEDFSNPLEVGVELPIEIEFEESFSNPLDIHSTPYLLTEEIPEAFSEPLELDPPRIQIEQFENKNKSRLSKLYSTDSGPYSDRTNLYGNNNASLSAPSFSDLNFEDKLETDSQLTSLPPYSNNFSLSNSNSQFYSDNRNLPNISYQYDPSKLYSSFPTITPRKESMINLGKTWGGATSLRSPTQIDSLLSSQRRSSLYYDSEPKLFHENDNYRFKSPHSPSFSPPSSYLRPNNRFDTLPNHKKTLSSSRHKVSGNDGSFLGNLLPDFLNPFSKHSRKLSCPENLKFDKNKVIQVSLEDGSTYSVNIGGCCSTEEIIDAIFSTLLLDNDNRFQLEEFIFNNSTRLVPPQHLLTVCSRTDNKGFIRLKLTKSLNPYNTKVKSPPIHEESLQPSYNNQPDEDKKSIINTQAPDPVLPSWAQLWGERPSTEVISYNLDEFFPDHDLDQQILEEVEHPELGQPVELGRKRSIRMIVKEAFQRRLSSSQLSRRSTKLWGSRITQLKDEALSLEPSQPSLPPAAIESPPTSPTANTSNEDLTDFPHDLLEMHEDSSCQIQWVKGKAIGKGSFGRVYHALNAVTGEMLAVKIIDLPPPSNKKNNQPISRKRGDMIQELYREIELLKDLDHDNIVQYLGFEANPTSIHIFLEYVSGGSISSVLMKTGPFDELYATNLIRQTLRGLAYLHGRNILHRDIKAANVLINHEGVCKISDFGISKRNDYTKAYRYNSRMSFKGSVFWMAPEVVIDHGYSAKVDIWSLGCLLIEMLTGQRPWKELNELAAVYRLGKSAPESAPPIPPGISDDAISFMGQCFTIEPEQRPTAEQLLDHPFCTKGFKPNQFENVTISSSQIHSSPPQMDDQPLINLLDSPNIAEPLSISIENPESNKSSEKN